MIKFAPNVHAGKGNSTEDDLHFPPDLPPNFHSLVLPVDKPHGWSSFDVVRKLRRLLSMRKIGHAGTLDPMATGLLICLVGRATKRMEHFMHLTKEYEGTIRLGQTTATYDAEGAILEERPWEHLGASHLDAARTRFLGDIQQRTPMFSAVKVGGERLYKKARRGESVERPPRDVSVYSFEIADTRGRDVDFVVSCSRGTYIRALANDFGEALGCGGHLVALRRTGIGDVRVSQAWTIAALDEACGRRRGEEP